MTLIRSRANWPSNWSQWPATSRSIRRVLVAKKPPLLVIYRCHIWVKWCSCLSKFIQCPHFYTHTIISCLQLQLDLHAWLAITQCELRTVNRVTLFQDGGSWRWGENVSVLVGHFWGTYWVMHTNIMFRMMIHYWSSGLYTSFGIHCSHIAKISL